MNPSSLEALSRKAAIALLDDRTADFDALVGAVLAINPRYGDVYRLAGAQAARHYRFDAAASLARKALEIEPGNVRASADLGVHLLRTGDEPGARVALDTAFRADPYDVVTYNLLGLLDNLERFETSDDGVVTLRLHPDEAPVLREHALPLARKALDTLAARYGHTIDGRVLVEIFPKHDDFAVRNVGLPGMVGALGACFGRVVTLDSPRARPPGTFNWQATLWHEMAHVITLQMSNNRIPRWLTEGISVFEEQRARPEWGREMELRFADALERGEVIPLADLNRGFMSGETIALAYYEAALLVDHLVMTRGEPALQALVRAFADGVSVDEAMRRAVGPTLAEIEPEFVASVTERFAAVLAARRGPEDIRLTARTPRETIEALAAEYPGNVDLQTAVGRRARRRRRGAGRLRGVGARRLPAAVAGGQRQPAWSHRQSGGEPRRHRARHRRARTAAGARRHQHRGGAPAGVAGRSVARASARGAGVGPCRRARPLRRHGVGGPGAPCPRHQRAGCGRAVVPRGAGGRPGRQGRRVLRPRRKLPRGRRRAAGQAPGPRRARGRAVLRARAGLAAHARGWGPLMWRRALMLAGAVLAALAVAVPSAPDAVAQSQPGAHLAGLQWTFVRIKYTAHFRPGSNYRFDYWGEPWAIDAPAAEQNLSRRLKSVTAVEVGDPAVLTLEDPTLWQYPWIYFVEPGNLRLQEAEVPILREFLLAGRHGHLRRLPRAL